MKRAQAPSDELLELADQYEDIVILTHDNPDPDGIAAGWALSFLLEKILHKKPVVAAGGEILRAENRKLVELLQPPLQLQRKLQLPEGGLIILVDTSLDASNHVVIDTATHDVAVIDHHVCGEAETGRAVFRDVRDDVAATASLAASYLHEQDLVPCEGLATALLYAIQTETRGGQFFHSPLDRSILGWIAERANPSHLGQILDAPVARCYYSDLVLALQSTYVVDKTCVCFLPEAHSAEIVGEVADLLLRGDDIEGVVCAAVTRGDLLLSVRTAFDSTRSAVQLTHVILDGLGRGGGHAHRAGGNIRDFAVKVDREAILKELRSRWYAAWGVDSGTEQRLVSKDSIIRCL